MLKKKRKSLPFSMVSIIVPAYNAEKYLAECVESIFSQSVSDWELLLVDDGSVDSTPALCDSFVARDHRVRTIHRQNGGLSEARNTGMRHAIGEYVCFLDADDVMHSLFLESTLKAIVSTGAEIAGVSFALFSDSKPYKPQKEIPQPVVMTGRQAILHALYQTKAPGTKKKLASSAWGKLYKTEIWKDLEFRSGIWYEDLDVFYKVWERASKIAFVPADLIGYRQHPESFLHTFTLRRADVLDVTDRLETYYTTKATDPHLIAAARTRRFAAHCNIMLIMLLNRRKACNKKEAEEIMERCGKVIKALRHEILTNKKARLKDRAGGLLAHFMPSQHQKVTNHP